MPRSNSRRRWPGVIAVAVITMSALALPATPAVATGPAAVYWLLGGDGGVFGFRAPFHGSAASDPTRCPANTIDPRVPERDVLLDRGGSRRGRVLDPERRHRSRVRLRQRARVRTTEGYDEIRPAQFLPTYLAIVSTPTGNGYWVLALNLSGAATILHFGGAGFFGDSQSIVSRTHTGLNGTPVGMAAMPSGKGYWEAHSDGGVFGFGTAKFFGSMASAHLTSPVVGIAATHDGKGYWLASADGHVYPFGDAAHAGSMAGRALAKPIVGIVANPTGVGYWLVASDGGVFGFGGAPFLGSMGGKHLNRAIFAMTAAVHVVV